MHIEERVQAFSQLGKAIKTIDDDALDALAYRVANENPWFTKDNIKTALTGVSKLVDTDNLRQWLSHYQFPGKTDECTVALILAGNIPLVGFHDILTVLLSGHRAQIKASSKDTILTSDILNRLFEVEPRFRERITFVDKIHNFDAVIATGSDNSSRYFEYYFKKYPSIIRKNRTSVAVLTGFESPEELTQLGTDIFSYFGLGCRNVSKVYVPQGYDVTTLYPHWTGFEYVAHHHKYANNYDYQKAIMMVNKSPFYDNGFMLLTESEKLVSPISVLYYETYGSTDELSQKLNEAAEKIQCIVGTQRPATIKFGAAQSPGPSDYADNVDTLKFLLSLSKT